MFTKPTQTEIAIFNRVKNNPNAVKVREFIHTVDRSNLVTGQNNPVLFPSVCRATVTIKGNIIEVGNVFFMTDMGNIANWQALYADILAEAEALYLEPENN